MPAHIKKETHKAVTSTKINSVVGTEQSFC